MSEEQRDRLRQNAAAARKAKKRRSTKTKEQETSIDDPDITLTDLAQI